mgnify:FL=1
MPELPEVETVTRGLEERLTGKTLVKIKTRREGLRYPFPADLARCGGQEVLALHRRSKFVLMDLSGGYTLLLHLGMSGRLTFPGPGDAPQKHDHLSLYFSGGTEVRLNDPRRFGVVDLHKTSDLGHNRHIKNLGHEPLEPDFTPKALYTILKNKRVPVKQAIMDGRLVVGVGNIYASEALFRAGIRPTIRANRLTRPKLAKLHKAIQEVLLDAIAAGGTSLRDYVQTDGTLGYFQHRFNVYGRKGEPCKTCATPIKKVVQSGRAGFYCPACQK